MTVSSSFLNHRSGSKRIVSSRLAPSSVISRGGSMSISTSISASKNVVNGWASSLSTGWNEPWTTMLASSGHTSGPKISSMSSRTLWSSVSSSSSSSRSMSSTSHSTCV